MSVFRLFPIWNCKNIIFYWGDPELRQLKTRYCFTDLPTYNLQNYFKKFISSDHRPRLLSWPIKEQDQYTGRQLLLWLRRVKCFLNSARGSQDCDQQEGAGSDSMCFPCRTDIGALWHKDMEMSSGVLLLARNCLWAEPPSSHFVHSWPNVTVYGPGAQEGTIHEQIFLKYSSAWVHEF